MDFMLYIPFRPNISLIALSLRYTCLVSPISLSCYTKNVCFNDMHKAFVPLMLRAIQHLDHALIDTYL